jgi:hypothetical protein
LVNHGFEQGPGFSIRFTVEYNLFAGTVLELGGPAHLAALERMQADGTLGCFALTERLAGEALSPSFSLSLSIFVSLCLSLSLYLFLAAAISRSEKS